MRHLYILIAILSILFTACGEQKIDSEQKTIYVTINPLRSIVEELTCGDFEVDILVPRGASPESFEPTMQQISALNRADIVFKVGLIDFEQSLVENLNEDVDVVDLSEGIDVMAGCCSHGHKGHAHGIDPHIWCAPRTLGAMVRNMHSAIKQHYPDSTKYDTAANELLRRLESLDSWCQTSLDSANIEAIMIYHPAYTYLAHDYGIEQIAIEHDGKEPTPKQLTTLIEKARRNNIDVIFHQPQYNASKLSAIANEADAEIVVSDPLADDIIAEIERLINRVCYGER